MRNGKSAAVDRVMDLLTCRSGGIELRLAPRAAYSFALAHSGLTPVRSILARRLSDEPAGQATALIRVDIPGFVWEAELPLLDIGGETEIRPVAVEVDRDRLERITQPEPARLEVEFGPEPAASPLLLLSPWQWPLGDDALASLACYALKHDGIIRTIISESRLGSSRGSILPGRPCPETGGGTDPWADLGRLYNHLADHYLITYSDPLIVRHPSGVLFQNLRPPHRILFDRRDNIGEGTCVDLSLLMAGCLEGMGHAPLILVLFDEQGLPVHAFLGLRRSPHGRIHPLVRDAERLAQEAARGELLVVEATGVCAGQRQLAFAAAVEEAAGHLRSGRSLAALEVKALRPPRGGILPMETPFEPAVLLAHAEAADLASRLGSPLFETLHLLFGLARAGGDVTRALLLECGLPASDLAARIEEELSRRSGSGRRARTVGYDRCVADAAENARSEGSTVVRECDLWWAVLWSRSGSVNRALESAGCPQRQLVPLLEQLCPHSRRTTTMA